MNTAQAVNETRSVTMTPDTRLSNVEIVMLRDPVPITSGRGRSTQVTNFAIRKHNNFTDANGMLIEKQPLDLFCSTFDDAIINILKQLKVGDKISLQGYIEPVWRVFKANNQIGGITKDVNGNTLIVPEPGQSPMQLADGSVIYPDPQPYRLNDHLMNACVMPGASLNVVQLTPATQITSDQQVTDASDFGAIQQQLNDQQGNLNTATAPTQQQPQQQNGQHVVQTVVPSDDPPIP